ncbi:MAG: hypothetical protein HOF99_08885 [Rhodospirillaceae bacterium]|nr:hypothetical protein [Rhodospirillaceae bacterium]
MILGEDTALLRLDHRQVFGLDFCKISHGTYIGRGGAGWPVYLSPVAVEKLIQINEAGACGRQVGANSRRIFAMPVENIIILGILVASVVAFCTVAGWLTWESGKQRKNERQSAAAE